MVEYFYTINKMQMEKRNCTDGQQSLHGKYQASLYLTSQLTSHITYATFHSIQQARLKTAEDDWPMELLHHSTCGPGYFVIKIIILLLH